MFRFSDWSSSFFQMLLPTSLSAQLRKVVDPNYQYHRQAQAFMFGGIAYVVTTLHNTTALYFNSIKTIIPEHAALLMSTACLVQHYVTVPLFGNLLENYRQTALVPLTGQCLQVGCSLSIAQVIVGIFGCVFSTREVGKIGTLCYIGVHIIRISSQIV